MNLKQSRILKKIEAIGLVFLIQLLVTILLGGLAFYFFLELAEKITDKNPFLAETDAVIRSSINGTNYPALIPIMIAVTTMGSWVFVTVVASLLICFLLPKPGLRLFAFHVVLVTGGCMWLNSVLKNIFNRARPEGPYLVEVISTSYPSGHAMLSFGFYGLLIYFTWISDWSRTAKLFATFFLSLLILCIGLSRVYFGVHYPSDVVAGFAAGAFWLSLSLVTARTAERYFLKGRRKDQLENG